MRSINRLTIVAGTIAALTAMLDIMFQERGHAPLKEFQEGRDRG